jgi:hypothetical protein
MKEILNTKEILDKKYLISFVTIIHRAKNGNKMGIQQTLRIFVLYFSTIAPVIYFL